MESLAGRCELNLRKQERYKLNQKIKYTQYMNLDQMNKNTHARGRTEGRRIIKNASTVKLYLGRTAPHYIALKITSQATEDEAVEITQEDDEHSF